MMQSKARIFDHPLHPMLVALPVGLAVWTLFADIVYAVSDDATWYEIALYSGVGFWVTALAAAIPGLLDYSNLDRGSRAFAIASLHLTFNLVTVGVFVAATLLAWDDGARDGSELGLLILLHVAGVSLLSVSGWLGGEMVYRYGLGMIPGAPVGAGERAAQEVAPIDRPRRGAA
jgi:uncharacterized membrane protein